MSDNIPTMAELFRSCAHRPSEKIAIIAGREKMTYGEMLAAGSSLVRDLEDQGVSPGDFVYVNINTKIRFIITIVALLSRGYVVVPRTTSDEQALEKLLENMPDSKALETFHHSFSLSMTASSIKG